jgi:hypothetical protein
MIWVTGPRPKLDGIACSWLIRQHIDPDAEILYVPTDQVLEVVQRQGARSFDAPGAEFTRHGHRCTFEVLIDNFQLVGDPALGRLARIVHTADSTADPHTDPLAPGLAAIGQGGLDVEANDRWQAERGMFVYDALYAWCKRHTNPAQPAP